MKLVANSAFTNASLGFFVGPRKLGVGAFEEVAVDLIAELAREWEVGALHDVVVQVQEQMLAICGESERAGWRCCSSGEVIVSPEDVVVVL